VSGNVANSLKTHSSPKGLFPLGVQVAEIAGLIFAVFAGLRLKVVGRNHLQKIASLQELQCDTTS